MSHPSRVRGLKYRVDPAHDGRRQSHPSRVRGLKYNVRIICRADSKVAPFTGAWIEINQQRLAGRRQPGRTLHGCVD